MELAPGLLTNIFDGIQRPLEDAFNIMKNQGFLKKGTELPSLSRTKKWRFFPLKKINDVVTGGDVIGSVQETFLITHKIMVPPGASGKLIFIAEEDSYTIIDEIYKLERNGKEHSYSMLQKWPITKKRPFKKQKGSGCFEQAGFRHNTQREPIEP